MGTVSKVTCIFLLLAGVVLKTVRSESFTSIASLQQMVNTEARLRAELENYIIEEEKRLHGLKKKIELLRKHPDPYSETESLEYAGHPINAYQLIKLWHGVHDAVQTQSNANVFAFTNKLAMSQVYFPNYMDLSGAVTGVLRLQQTYRLPTLELAQGNIFGHRARDKLFGDDFYTFGASALHSSDTGLAAQWMKLATENHNDNSSYLLSDAFLKLSASHRQIGDYEQAAHSAREALEVDPHNYTVAREYEDATKIHNQVNLNGNYRPTYNADNYTKWLPSVRRNYEALCRGDFTGIERDLTVLNKLYCRYRPSRIPILLYKEEIHSFDPFIALLHDVLTPGEADLIKHIATPSLFRATVGDPAKAEQTRERVSKVAWLWDTSSHQIIPELSERVGHVTDLKTSYAASLSHAEPFQVVNYGIGGQYEPHYDFYEDKAMLDKVPHFILGTGDRLATFMFYLSSPVAGGATVFPKLGVRVPAQKYGAAFWYNLKRSGDMDRRTEHAGCPVLLGQKWVANKWIREYGQEFKRPCGLTEDSTDIPLPGITSPVS